MKEGRKTDLKNSITESNLSTEDKADLLKLLDNDNISMDDFIKHALNMLKLGSQTLKLFDIDLGDD